MRRFSSIADLKDSSQVANHRQGWGRYISAVTLPLRNRLPASIDSLDRALERSLAVPDIFDMVAKMTLVLLIIHGGGFWYIRGALLLLCTAALLYRSLRQSPIFWFVTAGALAASNYYNWYAIDNHKYLINYWCLAVGCSLLAPDRSKILGINARILIGLAFLFATLWKAISDDYLDGAFFHYNLLFENRFVRRAAFIASMNKEIFQENRQAIKDLIAFDSQLPFVQLAHSPPVGWLAQFLTWWSILIEGLIAAAFLWPKDTFLSRWRDIPLLIFIFSTYIVAPVIGFGWVLSVMGAAQSATSFKHMRLLYVLAFFVLPLYSLPWGSAF